ncbi:sensor histidine kinase [Paenibacillus montanisoli]|nr:sensor histidine kinase [Paenibacillus montanisoli]
MLRKPLPFQYRLIYVVILTVLLPSVLLNWLTFAKIKNHMLDDATAWLTSMTKNSGQTMESYIKLVNGVSKNPEFDYTLMDIFDRHRTNTEGRFGYSYDELSKINNWLTMLNQMDTNIVAVNFLDESGTQFHVGDSVAVDDKDWLKKTESLNGASAVWSPVTTEDGTVAFSVSRKLISPVTFHRIGAIQIFFRLDFLTQKENELFLKEGNFVILDKENKIVFEKSEDHGRLDDWNTSRQVKAAFVSTLTGWTLVGAVPKNVLFQKIDLIQKWVFIANGVFIFITMGVVFLISFQLTNPLRKLSKLMLNAVKRNFDIEAIPIKRYDEIGNISISFNRMIGKIHNLIREVTETEQMRKQSEITALQAQINPHFLYNTLGTIAMQAEIDGYYKVSDMASKLGRFLRYTIGNQQDWVEIAQECEHLGIYFRVMQFRYPLIEFELEIDERLKDWQVTRLILQPLVENAILHGIVPNGTEGKVKVAIQLSPEPIDEFPIHIRVEDTGVGMGQETVDELIGYLKGTGMDRERTYGIGLKNVYERVSLSYEDKFIFGLHSEEGKGTQIRIALARRQTYENHGGRG